MKQIKAIQMIGTQRSGSNLLRVMLNAIDDIVAPHPPHILQRFLPLLSKYGDLSVEDNFRNLSKDVCELVKLNPVPWEGVSLNVDDVIMNCKSSTLFELFRVVYETAAQQTNSSYWLCKSMKNVFYASEIEAAGIRPYYIYLYRDGRDVALSFKKAIVGEKHIYALAQGWKKDQEASFALIKITPSDRFFSLSYESLISEPEKVMHELCAFLNVNYSDKIMEYYKSSESNRTAIAGEMWSNVSKSIIKDNSRKFMRELSSEEISIFESVAGNVLLGLGYELVSSLDQLYDSFTEKQIIEFTEQNALLKESIKNLISPEDLEKRRPQDELIERIRAYVTN